VTGAGRLGLAVIVGRRGGDWLALDVLLEGLLAEWRVLAALQAWNNILSATEPLLHGLGFLAAEQLSALQAADGVEIVAKDTIPGRIVWAVVEVIPCGDQLPAVRLVHERIDLGPCDALGGTCAPDGHCLGTAHPTRHPHVGRMVVVEGSEEGGRRAVGAVVVKSAQLPWLAVGKKHPVQEAQVNTFKQGRNHMTGKRDIPDGEGVRCGIRLRSGAQRGDDQGRVVLDADLANRGPLFRLERALDPGDGVGFLC